MPHPKPTLSEQIFEARYERGYRYLDRCGDVMLVLEDLLAAETGKVWMPAEMQPTGARLKCPELDLAVTFDVYRLVVIQQPTEAQCNFANICDTILATIAGRFDLRVFTRFGNRRTWIIGTDSVADADALAVKLSPIKDWPLHDPETSMSNCEAVCVRETADGMSGYRFELSSVARLDAPEQTDQRLRMPAKLLPTGQREALIEGMKRARQREKSPLAGLKLDLDVYVVRPEKVAVKEFLSRTLTLEQRILDAVLGREHR